MRLVPDEETERQALVAEARQISMSAPVLFPMLDKRRSAAIQRMLGNYRDGKMDQGVIAEIFVISSIQEELRNKLNNLKLSEEK